jgi:hypothetical protein
MRPSRGGVVAVPVVYNKRLDPLPLTQTQVGELLAEAAPRCPDGRGIWFIYVRASYLVDGEPYIGAGVYFTPEAQEPRMRKGKCTGVAILPSSWKSELETLREQLRRYRPDADLPAVWDYCQVSRAGEPFTDRLGPPEGNLLPFDPPTGLWDAEIIDVVDFARRQTGEPRVEKLDDKHWNVRPGFDGSAPILKIARTDGVIEVKSGTVEGLLSGAGQILRCRRNERGFEIVDVSDWVS